MENDPKDQVLSSADADWLEMKLEQEDANLKASRLHNLLFVVAKWRESNRDWWQNYFTRKKRHDDNFAHRVDYNLKITRETGKAPQRYGKTWIEPQRPDETKADFDKRYHREYMRGKRAAKRAAKGKGA